MKELKMPEVQAVSGGFWHIVLPIVIGFGGVIIDGIRHRRDKDLASREGMDPTRRESTGF